MRHQRLVWKLFSVVILCGLAACSSRFFPSAGPSRSQVKSADNSKNVQGIQVLEINNEVARRLMDSQKTKLFSETFPEEVQTHSQMLNPGDRVEVILWEAPPAVLFAGLSSVSHLPEQMVNSDGEITIPFAGRLKVQGLTLKEVENEISRRLRGKANQPQVLVRVTGNNTSNVIVVGDVNTSTRVPLTPKGERLLDALAGAGGVRQSVNKTTLQLSREGRVHSLPLETIIKDPRQNIFLKAGDVITSLYQSLSFTVLGATGRNEEINFEAQGISLSQALARAGGLNDNRADATGVFVFRFEDPASLDIGSKEVIRTPEGLVPVVYQLNLKDPASFFVAQNFPVQHKDVLYVANATGAQLQKFLNMLQATMFSTRSLIQTGSDIDELIQH